MESKSSSPCYQHPATILSSELHEPSESLISTFSKLNFNSIPVYVKCLQGVLFPSRFPTTTSHTFLLSLRVPSTRIAA